MYRVLDKLWRNCFIRRQHYCATTPKAAHLNLAKGTETMLEIAYYISQIIAVILILGSLIFVGIEIRQNTEQASQSNAIARADLSERLLTRFNDTWAMIATEEAVSIGFEKTIYAEGKLTRSENVRLLTWFNNLLNNHFNAFLLVGDGLIDNNMLRAFDNNIAWCLSFDIFDAEWNRLLDTGLDFSPGFVAHLTAHRAVWAEQNLAKAEPTDAPPLSVWEDDGAN